MTGTFPPFACWRDAIRAILCSVLLAVLAPGLAFAAELPAPGDKTGGEEELIEMRRQWFRSRRDFAQVEHPDLARAAAVEETKRAIALQRQAPLSDAAVLAGTPWQPQGPAPMSMLSWAMGPVAGRIDALAFEPGDENVIYLGGASGGLWKTFDGGQSWTPLFDQVGTTSIGAIFVDPAEPSTVWVGTGEHHGNCQGYFGLGLFRSTDRGATWAARNGAPGSELPLSYISSVVGVVDASQAPALLVGGTARCAGFSFEPGGVYRSTDDGGHWTNVLAGRVTDLIVDPGNPAIVYAALGRSTDPTSAALNGVYKSMDAGVTWSRLETGLPFGDQISRLRLAIAPSQPQTLYALVYGPIPPNGYGTRIWRTLDGGISWTNRTGSGSACEGQCAYNLTLAVHPTDPATLLVGSIRFARSTDGGQTLTYLTDGWGPTQTVHQDTHVLRYSPAGGNRFWVGGDGGLWRTDDGGVTFHNLNGNLAITQLYDVAIRPDDPGTIFGGAQDNSSSRRVGDPQWAVTIVTGDGFNNAVDPGDPNVVFQTSYPFSGFPRLVRSTSGGDPNSFFWLGTSGLVPNELYGLQTPLAIADPGPSTPSQLFLASHFVYRAATNQSITGFTWTKISPSLSVSGFGTVTALTASAVGGGIVLLAGTIDGASGSRLYRATGAEAGTPTFQDVTGDYDGFGPINDIAIDAADIQRMYVASGGFGLSVYRTADGGAHWFAATGVPAAPANTVIVDPLMPQRVFVGTDVGVSVSNDFGVTFSPLMTSFPIGVPVVDLEVGTQPHALVAGTYGRGAFTLALPPGIGTELVFRDGFELGSVGAWTGATP